MVFASKHMILITINSRVSLVELESVSRVWSYALPKICELQKTQPVL